MNEISYDAEMYDKILSAVTDLICELEGPSSRIIPLCQPDEITLQRDAKELVATDLLPDLILSKASSEINGSCLLKQPIFVL